MRPVDKGLDRLLNNLSEARDILSAQVGEYCAYCEIRLDSLQIDHIHPQSTHPELITDWSNLLFACGDCNQFKSNRPPDNCYLPHAHNTALAFTYLASLPPAPSASLTDSQRIMAQNTINLTGLHRTNGQRQRRREEVFGKAKRALVNYLQDIANPAMQEQIIDTATSTGFFSVWMAVFQDYPEIRGRLLQAFPGTATNCFDANGNPAESPTHPLS